MIRPVLAAAIALGACACAGCADTAASGYPVAAEVELSGGGISGPLELLGTATTAATDEFHTLAAYRIQLPDDAFHRVQVLSRASCDAPDDPTHPFPIADLGAIRRVGGETHFFALGIHAGSETVDLDTGTTQGTVSTGADSSMYVIGAIAVVLSYDVDTGAAGAREACGAFALTRP